MASMVELSLRDERPIPVGAIYPAWLAVANFRLFEKIHKETQS
jgi:hypothetical protein